MSASVAGLGVTEIVTPVTPVFCEGPLGESALHAAPTTQATTAPNRHIDITTFDIPTHFFLGAGCGLSLNPAQHQTENRCRSCQAAPRERTEVESQDGAGPALGPAWRTLTIPAKLLSCRKILVGRPLALPWEGEHRQPVPPVPPLMAEPTSEVTRLIRRWSQGEEGAFENLLALVYDELRQLAHHHLGLGDRDAVLDTTVLVHEAYLRMVRVGNWDGHTRAQFFAFCSQAMRHILIDFARGRKAAKRGGGVVHVKLQDDMAAMDSAVADLLVVEDVLERLESKNPRMSRVFVCRHYGGMSVQETAEALGTSQRTVAREWVKARAYLSQALGYDRAAGSEAT